MGSLIAGKYQIEGLIGQGGMGTVWRALNVRLEIPVAIKWLRTGQNHGESFKRLLTEARAIAKLVHPSIVRVFDADESEAGEPFIVMELLRGESFSDVLQREGSLSCVEAVRTLLPIVEGLLLAHDHGVVHRDLKPDNIFICSDADADGQQPKLLDFGIAKVTSGVPSHSTANGALIGSPEYMSPEQVHAKDDIDFRSDIWSFCIVLYEAIAGKTPFSGANLHSLLCAIVEDAPPRPSGIDDELWSVLERGLSKDRAQRQSSVFEVGRQLAEWLDGQEIPTDVAGGSLKTKWLDRTGHSQPPRSAPSSSRRGMLRPAPLQRWRWRTFLTAAASTALVLATVAWSVRRDSSVAIDASAQTTESTKAPSAEPAQIPEQDVAPTRQLTDLPLADAPVPRAPPAPSLAKSAVPSRTTAPKRQPAATPPVATPPAATLPASPSAVIPASTETPEPPRPAPPRRDPALDLMQPY